MLTNVILTLIAIEGAVGIGLAYKSLKTANTTKIEVAKSTTTIEELKVKVDEADKSLKNEIREQINKQFFHIAFVRFRP